MTEPGNTKTPGPRALSVSLLAKLLVFVALVVAGTGLGVLVHAAWSRWLAGVAAVAFVAVAASGRFRFLWRGRRQHPRRLGGRDQSAREDR